MFTFLLVVHTIIAAALVAVILMQRSEGGGLGMGGSPSGLMSARGAADFLTRATTILATIFIIMSIGLAALATVQRAPSDIDTSLARTPAAPANQPAVPLDGDPLRAAAGAVGSAVPAAPAPALTDRPSSVEAPQIAPPAKTPAARTPAPKAAPAAPKAAPVAPKASESAPLQLKTPAPSEAAPAPTANEASPSGN